MANASSSGDFSTLINNNDEIKKLIESEEEELEQNNDEINILIESIEEELKEVSSLQSCYTIYRVPRGLYKQKPNAYTPQSVSIGPLHHNDEHLRIMETHKLYYLYRLLDRSGKTLEFCVKALSGLEEEARRYYSDTMSLRKSEFVKMMVIDSCFILEFLEVIRDFISKSSNSSKKDDSFTKKIKEDHFVYNESWCVEIGIDMIKLENQLPLFVLEHLFALIVDPYDEYFSFSWYVYWLLISPIAKAQNGPTFSSVQEFESLLQAKGGAKHFLDLLRCILMPSSPRVIPSNEKYVWLPYNASELKSAGVKFQKKENASLFDIDFDMRKGVLTIPTLKIHDETEVVFRNLIAFEQDKPYTDRYFTAYAAFMDDLVDTANDVTLLTEKGIIINRLGSPEDVTTLFNNIVKHVVVGNPYFTGVTKDLNECYSKSWNKRMANLRQTYFNSPWAGFSVAAAAFVIILTVIQTICSLFQSIK